MVVYDETTGVVHNQIIGAVSDWLCEHGYSAEVVNYICLTYTHECARVRGGGLVCDCEIYLINSGLLELRYTAGSQQEWWAVTFELGQPAELDRLLAYLKALRGPTSNILDRHTLHGDAWPRLVW